MFRMFSALARGLEKSPPSWWTLPAILVPGVPAVFGVCWLLASPPANAQIPPGITVVPLGYCQLTSIDAATLISTCAGGIPARANLAVIKTEAQAIRWRDDGTSPTASVGLPMAVADAPLYYSGTLPQVSVISQVAGAKLNVLFYRSP